MKAKVRKPKPVSKPSLNAARAALRKVADADKVAVYRSFFRDCDDVFLGVTTPKLRALAKAFAALPYPALARLIHSKVHEERTLAHAVLVIRFKRGDADTRKQVFDFFLKHRRTIRTWDEVDGAAPYIVGPYLMDRSKVLLHRLIRSPNLWDRRIALVATWPMIRKGHIADTLALAEKVLDDGEDLIHKATGWMLREVGKQDVAALTEFLKRHYPRLARTALRYAIERFPKAKRLRALKGQFG